MDRCHGGCCVDFLGVAIARSRVSLVVATAEIFFKPHIRDNEKIATSHLANLQFRDSGATISPRDGDDLPVVAADNRLEREFHGDIEVGRQNWHATLDDLTSISLERIGGVVQAVPEENAYEKIRRAVKDVLNSWIVYNSAAWHESAPKHAIHPCVQFVPVASDIPTVIGFVGHHYDDGISGKCC